MDSGQADDQETSEGSGQEAQQNGTVNLLDGDGKKMGLWIENKGLIEAYYSEGLRHGLFRHYSRKTGKLSAFGEFDKGMKTGTWYFFNEESVLILKESGVKKNNKTLERSNGISIPPSFSCKATFYHSNGMKSEEGELMYDDVEIDYFKVGQWSYFGEDGSLVETKEHS